MAFDFNFLSNTGGTAPAPIIYTYQTEDLRAVVLAEGYFDNLYTKIKVKDLITIVNTIEVYTVRITAVGKKSVTTVKTPLLQREHVEYHLTTTPEVISIDDDGTTYVPIPNMVKNIGSAEFDVTSGILTYLGSGGRFLINGTSDLEINKAADITYALVLDGVPIPSELTTIGFTSAGKKRNISITAIAPLTTDQTIEIWVKGDATLGITLTVNKLDVTFLEI